MFSPNTQAATKPRINGGVPPMSATMPLSSKMQAALRLHQYLAAQHWNGRALIGPDVGIRINYRLGRFVKSYFPRIAWKDDYYYLQAQGYWILDNWQLFASFGDNTFRDIAVRCSDYMLTQQRNDGAWVYPNPEWRGRIATAEGTWGSLGLLESYRRTGDTKYLAGARKWYRFLVGEIGFQQVGPELAVNYFYGRKGLRIPNNSAFLLRFLAELADATGQEVYLGLRRGLMKFLQAAQEPTGEFPYAVKGHWGGECWPHFQCYQYNAFQCLDLMRYFDFTGDATVLPLIESSLSFLRSGLAEDGHAYFECGNRHREVTYHTAVLAQALAKAPQFRSDADEALGNRAYSYLLALQRPDGGFGFSRRDYFILSDQRSYPRNLAMILYHLLPVTPVQAHYPARSKFIDLERQQLQQGAGVHSVSGNEGLPR